MTTLSERSFGTFCLLQITLLHGLGETYMLPSHQLSNSQLSKFDWNELIIRPSAWHGRSHEDRIVLGFDPYFMLRPSTMPNECIGYLLPCLWIYEIRWVQQMLYYLLYTCHSLPCINSMYTQLISMSKYKFFEGRYCCVFHIWNMY